MSTVTKPLLLDETGKAIVAALQSTEVVQQRVQEITEAAWGIRQEVVDSIPPDYYELLERLPQVDEGSEQYQLLDINDIDKTLTHENMAADAKATGDRAILIEKDISALKDQKADVIIGEASGQVVILDGLPKSEIRNVRVYGKTTQDGTPTPEAPIPLVSAGDEGLALTVAGRNFIKLTTGTYSSGGVTFVFNAETGIIRASGTTTGATSYPIQSNIPIPPAGMYRFSACPAGGGAKTYRAQLEAKKADGTTAYYTDVGIGTMIEVTDDIVSIMAVIVISSNQSVNLEFKPILSYGTEWPEFSPYGESVSATIPTPNGLPGIPVSSGGNYTDGSGQMWICDEIDLERGMYIKRIGKKVIDGSTIKATYNANGFISTAAFKDAVQDLSKNVPLMSNARKWDSGASWKTGGFGIEYGTFWFEDKAHAYGAYDEGYNTWLASNPITIIYPLAESVETAIDSGVPSGIKNFDIKKHGATIYNSAFASQAVTYATDTKGYIDKKQSDAEAYGLPVLRLYGDTSLMTKNDAVPLTWKYDGKSGKCTCKWQGSSSVNYPKKNYTIKFDTELEPVVGWTPQQNFCFKANWIDASHARNIVNAKLWGAIVKSRTVGNDRLNALINGGAIDGFPCIIMLNDEFTGLFTWNIPKDGWMMGMGDGDSECILCAANDVLITQFKQEAVLDGTDFDIEYVSDEDDAGWVATSLNRLISAVMASDGSDLDTTVAQYLDWESAIDYYIFVCLVYGHDMSGKNYLLSTYDGVKWFFGGYDMDCTYDLFWDGTHFIGGVKTLGFAAYAAQNNVMRLIRTYKKDALKRRYAEVRDSIMSEINVQTMFRNFVGGIPAEVYAKERKLWNVPLSSVNDANQIADFYRLRVAVLDAEIDAL